MPRSTRFLFCAPREIVANHAKITITTGHKQPLRLGQKAQSKTGRRRIAPYQPGRAARATAPAAEPPRSLTTNRYTRDPSLSRPAARERDRVILRLLLGILSDNVVKRSCLPILPRENRVSVKDDGERA